MFKCILTLSLFASLNVFASETNSFVCKEVEKENSQIIVKVQELKEITDEVAYGHDYDFVLSVAVTVEELQADGNYDVIKKFKGIATSSDVSYGITSLKKNGFQLHRYLDEENQDGVTLVSDNGSKVRYNMNCTIED